MKTSTNVWVPTSAVTALDTIKVRKGYRSWNQTLERLLAEYVDDQRRREPDERLVHIATLLRWPPPRRVDLLTAEQLGIAPSGRQLRLQVDQDLWTTARDHGFVLPGQSIFRGHNEYQARRGADAVLTSIARREWLDDPEMGDIAQLLTRRQSRGLWRMAVAGTSTKAEREVLDAAECATEEREIACARGESDRGPERVVRVADKLLTSEVAWHASERFQGVRAIALENLSGDGAQDYLDLLDEVDDDTARWQDELARTRAVPLPLGSREGRGATAVWRAERAVQIEDLMSWFGKMRRTSTPATFVMNPPGWQLRFPAEWMPTLIGDTMPERREEYVRTGQVLHFRHGNRDYLWPTRENDDGMMVPVTGFETVISEARKRSVWDVLEATLLDFSYSPHGDRSGRSVWVPAHVAYDLGLLDEADRDRLVSEARTEYAAAAARSVDERRHPPAMNVDVLFADLDEKGHYRSVEDRERARMAYARGFRSFLKYLAEIDYPALKSERLSLSVSTAYRWPMTTLAGEVQSGNLASDALRWLAAYVLSRHHAILNADEQWRWILAEKYNEVDTTFLGTGNSALDRPIIDNEWAPDVDDLEAPF